MGDHGTLRVPGRVGKDEVDWVALGRCRQGSGTCTNQHEAASGERVICHERMRLRNLLRVLDNIKQIQFPELIRQARHGLNAGHADGRV